MKWSFHSSKDLFTWRMTVLTAVLLHASPDALITQECHFMMDFTPNCDFLHLMKSHLLNHNLLEGALASFSNEDHIDETICSKRVRLHELNIVIVK